MNDNLLQNEFLKGSADIGLTGFYKGELTRLFPASIPEIVGALLLNIWLPWHGKFFYPQEQLGDNIMSSKLASFIKFLYRDFSVTKPADGKFHAFPFHTYAMPGLLDPINVLQINYDLPQNPPVVRKIIDELVLVGDHEYLGKCYFVNNNMPRLVAYFRLKKA